MLNRIIKFFLDQPLITVLITVGIIVWGIAVAPFPWESGIIPRDPVPVDAIPDLGENQQIVFTEWPGRSPQDIEDQVTYPLTTALLGVPGVRTIRSNSMFGLSSIYVIFNEGVDFYWSRSRILEKINALPAGTLPQEVQPALGPDATALGQVIWYTLEGRTPDGKPAGGWDPQELRTIQDFYVKYALASSEGVSEVASIGGYVKEYQVDIDPTALQTYNISLNKVIQAVKESNLDVGARTIEFNKAEYFVRGLGYIKNVEDLEKAVIGVKDNVPVRIKDVGRVVIGPATRRGGLDKAGVEAVGGVVVARYGSNPLEVINNVKDKVAQISEGLPQKTLEDGTVSKVTLVPFYDRTQLIKETLGTLEEALILEILISIIVVIILVFNLRASVLISSLLPLGVLITFILMKYTGIAANIVALSGIAIAIGVMVDVGVVFTENILRHLKMSEKADHNIKKLRKVIYDATVEVAPAVITALATTIISFIPVFTLTGQEGKLFTPLAFTKTYALIAALIIGVVVIPTFAWFFYSMRQGKVKGRRRYNFAMGIVGIILLFFIQWAGIILIALSIINLSRYYLPEKYQEKGRYLIIAILILFALITLSSEWMPLGASNSSFNNLLFVGLIMTFILGLMLTVLHYYESLLKWALNNKGKFLLLPVLVLLWGLLSWQGFNNTFFFINKGFNAIGWNIGETRVWGSLSETFPGVGREFMPELDEGSFLLMPTTMPHSGVEENIETIQLLDRYVTAIPEVDVTVGKWGRASSALDPAPISMFENVVNYKPEYILSEYGYRLRFKVNEDGHFVLKDGNTYDPAMDQPHLVDASQLVPDEDGLYFRNWRSHIKSPDDIWNEIIKVANLPGMTSAPKLQPIATRLVMLSTGMRAPMGIKIYGPSLEAIEAVGFKMEDILKEVPGVKASSVFADRMVGKPYLQIEIDREAISRYGLNVTDVQKYISTAIGGMPLTKTVEGRERYDVRVRYARDFRQSPEDISRLMIPTPTGAQVQLSTLANISYLQGPQNIKSEDTFLVGYVIFDKETDYAEVDVVENAQTYIADQIAEGRLSIPSGVSYKFAGNYEHQIRAANTLMIVIPLSLITILLILYFQFRHFSTTLIVFSGVFVAFAGGFILIWLYGQEWFLNFNLFGENIRSIFQIHTINLSVAVWVGFIALFGIATDDGVIMGTYLKQVFSRKTPETKKEIRESVLIAGKQRVRPALMTAATTIIALLPVLTSTGKGSDIMVPMAIPTFGGMTIQMMTMFVVPVLYSWWNERKAR